jgi:type VI protein secretion system component Hcp
LWTAAVTGQVFNEVRIDFLKDGLFQYKYYELTLTNAQVTSITASPDALVEQLSISGDSATLKYYEQSADGTIRAPVAATVECK